MQCRPQRPGPRDEGDSSWEDVEARIAELERIAADAEEKTGIKGLRRMAKQAIKRSFQARLQRDWRPNRITMRNRIYESAFSASGPRNYSGELYVANSVCEGEVEGGRHSVHL